MESFSWCEVMKSRRQAICQSCTHQPCDASGKAQVAIPNTAKKAAKEKRKAPTTGQAKGLAQARAQPEVIQRASPLQSNLLKKASSKEHRD
jgi:hypothetical protein